jgi:DNA-binding MarR family transcriptional regulator
MPSTHVPSPPAFDGLAGDLSPHMRLSYALGRLDHVVRRHMEERLTGLGISLSQYTTLSILTHRGDLSNARLARRSLVSRQAMNGVLLSLEQAGLIERDEASGPNRNRPARLTAKGAEVTKQAEKSIDEMETRMLQGIPAEIGDILLHGVVACTRNLLQEAAHAYGTN